MPEPKFFGVWGVVTSNDGHTIVSGFLSSYRFTQLAPARKLAEALNRSGNPNACYWGKRIPSIRVPAIIKESTHV